MLHMTGKRFQHNSKLLPMDQTNIYFNQQCFQNILGFAFKQNIICFSWHMGFRTKNHSFWRHQNLLPYNNNGCATGHNANLIYFSDDGAGWVDTAVEARKHVFGEGVGARRQHHRSHVNQVASSRGTTSARQSTPVSAKKSFVTSISTCSLWETGRRHDTASSRTGIMVLYPVDSRSALSQPA